jgi:hypothetical protein
MHPAHHHALARSRRLRYRRIRAPAILAEPGILHVSLHHRLLRFSNAKGGRRFPERTRHQSDRQRRPPDESEYRCAQRVVLIFRCWLRGASKCCPDSDNDHTILGNLLAGHCPSVASHHYPSHVRRRRRGRRRRTGCHNNSQQNAAGYFRHHRKLGRNINRNHRVDDK